MSPMYLEDFEAGQVFLSPGYTLTESAIIDFALKYDCQPFHLDVERAKASIYGGLIASGWQVGALAFRLFLSLNLVGESSLGSPGLDELRWLVPVRPGDTIRTRGTVVEVEPSRSKPDRGAVHFAWEVFNQRDQMVMTFKSVQLITRRPAAGP